MSRAKTFLAYGIPVLCLMLLIPVAYWQGEDAGMNQYADFMLNENSTIYDQMQNYTMNVTAQQTDNTMSMNIFAQNATIRSWANMTIREGDLDITESYWILKWGWVKVDAREMRDYIVAGDA